MTAIRLFVTVCVLAAALATQFEIPANVEGYRCSAPKSECEVVRVSDDRSAVTMQVAPLPRNQTIQLFTPSGAQDVKIPTLPGSGVENCEAEVTCANGEVKKCSTITDAVAWACSAGGGAATCMYLPANYLDQWMVTTVTCD